VAEDAANPHYGEFQAADSLPHIAKLINAKANNTTLWPLSGTDAVGVPQATNEKSSTAKPSSEPVASKSVHRNQNVASAGSVNASVAKRAVLFSVSFPFRVPTLPLLFGVRKSSASKSNQVPLVNEVASRLY
jgi:hypothetical protein